MSGDDEQTHQEFCDAVNMTRGELERWLATDESQSVGVTSGGEKKTRSDGGESVGHESGRRIVAILATKKAELDERDYAHMRKVVGYVKRHSAQRPVMKPIEDSRWRYSLMNWGHDPLKP